MPLNVLTPSVIGLVVYFSVFTSVEVDGSLASLSSALAGVGSLFEYHTSELLQNEDEGVIAAFGNYNGDEFVDIFVITNNSQTLDVLLANENNPYTRVSLLHINDAVITSVVPTDFNGDVQMDIMLITRPILPVGVTTATSYNVSIHWGNHSTGALGVPLILPESFRDEPLLFDYNGDMIPDLLGETAAGVRKVWISHRNKTFNMITFPDGSDDNGTKTPFAVPQSHAFIDINSNFLPDLVLTTEKGYELWANEDGIFKFNMTYEPPESNEEKYIGQSTYTDLDQDKLMEQIVPVCTDNSCTQSSVFVRSKGQWIQLMGPDDLVYEDKQWNFVPPEKNKYNMYTNQSFPVALRFTDYNLDGYPDAIVLLRNNSGDVQRLFLLENAPCKGDLCDTYPRTFHMKSLEDGSSNNNALLGTFYDIYDDGTPDVVMVKMTHDPVEDSYTPRLVLMKNDIALDSCFVKVTVASGLCYKDCPESNSPYGVNYPGATITYRTTKTDGSTQQSAGTQFSQTAHYALQTPYQTFGLGDTPNFIEELYVSIPTPPNKEKRDRSWPFIIPNSQLIVIPHPPNNPNSWLLKLFITPSQLVYLTGAALLGTCGFVAGIVGVLQWREKREDKLEKKQESQRFHFDAM